jgi:hypothetical protein
MVSSMMNTNVNSEDKTGVKKNSPIDSLMLTIVSNRYERWAHQDLPKAMNVLFAGRQECQNTYRNLRCQYHRAIYVDDEYLHATGNRLDADDYQWFVCSILDTRF